jgi:hypothetical protein
VLADLALLALAGGLFSVPLYAVLQTAGEAGSRDSAVGVGPAG